jgi:hypothetical protein
LGAFVFVFSLTNLFVLKESFSRTVISDILSPLINAFATLGLSRCPPLSRSFKTIRNCLVSLHGRAVVLHHRRYQLGSNRTRPETKPLPFFADFWYIAYYPFFIAGTYYISNRKTSPMDLIKKLLDLGIIMLAAILGFLNFLILPLAESISGESLLFKTLTLTYRFLICC